MLTTLPAHEGVRIWALYLPHSGDFIMGVGASLAEACESARSSLAIDEDTEILVAEGGDAIEMLGAQYGGACVCSSVCSSVFKHGP